MRQALLQAGVDGARVRVVPSGVEPERFQVDTAIGTALRQEWQVPAEATLVVQLSVLETRKGHAVLLAAAARLQQEWPQLRYALCGDGRMRDSLAETVIGGALPVQFVGFRHDVAACLAAADLVVVPSLQEGLGVAALEAMAASRPVIASRVGGLPEVVVDGTTGLLVPPGDVTALAAAIAALARDPVRRTVMGRAGAARVGERFTIARMAAGTLACYEELA